MTLSLQEIGQEEYTEKANYGYLPIYEQHWKHLQNEPITLLEIGVYNGNSVRTWCRWFPNATIVGIDHNPNNPMRTDRTNLHFGLQEDIDFLKEVADTYNGFDIVIDDGSHKWADQQISFAYLWQHIKPGGMYIIEDLHTSSDPWWRKYKERDTVNALGVTVYDAAFGQNGVYCLEVYKSLAIVTKDRA